MADKISDNDEYEECQHCKSKVKSVNMDKHIRKVHGGSISNSKIGSKGSGAGKSASGRLALLEEKRKKRNKVLAVSALVILILAGGWWVYSNFMGNSNPSSNTNIGKAWEDDTHIYVPVSRMDDGELHKYSYKTQEGKVLRYFLIRGPDSKYHAGIDLCVKLHPGNTGWIQEDDMIVCQGEFCSYPINALNSGQPGCCTPMDLEFQIVDGNYQIRKDDLEAAGQYLQ